MAIFRRQGCTRASRLSSQQLLSRLTAHARSWWRSALRLFVTSLLCLTVVGCAQSDRPVRLLELPDKPIGNEVKRLSGDISEVAPPAIFLDLANLASDLQPQVDITYPKNDQVLTDTELTAKIKLRGLSIYKEEETGLGPHLHIILDNQPAQPVYDLNDPIEFSDLTPGSHTLRVFAVRPWGESFKNEGAYAQTTFHIFARTAENTPDPDLPLLTYNEPQGTFGAQPVLLDFYLSNAPLHLVAQEDIEDDIQDWQIQCTVNGQAFLFEQWQPVYLKGLKSGQNWVQLSLVDEQGRIIDNAFNSTVRLVNYDPDLTNTLAQLVRGELPVEQIGQIMMPGYEPPVEPLPAEPPVEETPAEEAPIEKVPAPAEEIPVESPVEEAPAAEMPTEEAPVEEIPIEKVPEQMPVELRPTEQLNETLTKETSDAEKLDIDDESIYDRKDEGVEDESSIEEVPFDRDSPINEKAQNLEAEEKEDLSRESDIETFSLEEDNALVLPDSAEANDIEVDSPATDRLSEVDRNRSDRSNTTEMEEPAVDNVPVPENLSDPLEEIQETELDFPAADEPSPASILFEDEPIEPAPPSQSGFFERMKNKWRSFQKEQFESQSETIRPSQKAIAPTPPAKTESTLDLDELIDDVDTPYRSEDSRR